MSWWRARDSKREIEHLKFLVSELSLAISDRDDTIVYLQGLNSNRVEVIGKNTDEIMGLEEQIDALTASNKELTDKLVECQRKLGRVNTDCQMARNAITSAIASTEAEGCPNQNERPLQLMDAVLTVVGKMVEVQSWELELPETMVDSWGRQLPNPAD